jgi:hypothetical protein
VVHLPADMLVAQREITSRKQPTTSLTRCHGCAVKGAKRHEISLIIFIHSFIQVEAVTTQAVVVNQFLPPFCQNHNKHGCE